MHLAETVTINPGLPLGVVARASMFPKLTTARQTVQLTGSSAMDFRLPALATPLLVSLLSVAQVTIQNPHRLDIPEQRVQILHRIICRVVADEFHVRASQVEGPVTLVLGEAKQPTIVDEVYGGHTIHLDRWNEVTFAISDTQLAVQRMLSEDRFERIASEVIRRVGQAAPVSANSLRSPKGSVSLPSTPSSESNFPKARSQDRGRSD